MLPTKLVIRGSTAETVGKNKDYRQLADELQRIAALLRQ
jgi:hypothetical protein